MGMSLHSQSTQGPKHYWRGCTGLSRTALSRPTCLSQCAARVAGTASESCCSDGIERSRPWCSAVVLCRLAYSLPLPQHASCRSAARTPPIDCTSAERSTRKGWMPCCPAASSRRRCSFSSCVRRRRGRTGRGHAETAGQPGSTARSPCTPGAAARRLLAASLCTPAARGCRPSLLCSTRGEQTWTGPASRPLLGAVRPLGRSSPTLQPQARCKAAV